MKEKNDLRGPVRSSLAILTYVKPQNLQELNFCEAVLDQWKLEPHQ
jgi:hypothetical protein